MGETLYSGGLALALGMRLWYRWMTRQRVVTRSAVTWREYGVLGFGFVGILVIPLLHVTTPIFASATYHLPAWAGWLGTALFGGTIDWTLIETHWQDLMQVVISINEGTILASTILRKLRHDSKRNKLYKAFREVGRVIRTVVLLRSISSLELRQQVLSMTNKVEAFNGFAAWVFFSNYGIIDTNDPAEQEKRLHYRDVVANALILQNTIDLSQALRQLRAEGYPVRRDLVAHLSPYPTQHLRRYGDYPHHFEHMPEPIDPTCDLGDEGDG